MQIFINTLAQSLFGGGTDPNSGQFGPQGRTGLFERAFQDLNSADILAGGFAASSAISRIASGISQSRAAQVQSDFAQLNASQTLIEGRRQSADTLEDLSRNIAFARVSAAASGLQESGSVASGISESIRRGSETVGAIQDNAIIGQQLELVRSRAIRLGGRDELRAGIAQGFFSLGDSALKINERRLDRKERKENG